MHKPTVKQENEFVKTYLVFDKEDTNINSDFSTMSKKMGPAYFEYLKAAWACNDDIFTEEEFCKINGNVPVSFFKKNIKDCVKEFEVFVKEY